MAATRILVMALAAESMDTGDVFIPRSVEPSSVRLSLSKPSWIVKSESNVRKEVRKKPNPPCVVCQGSGRVDCYGCCGKGRTNHVDLSMLPKGVWPKWCKTCRGSGLAHCSRCLGTGEYRYVMGFQFMKREMDSAPNHQVQPNPKQQRSAVDLLLNGEDQCSNEDDQLNGTPKSST
ncbi:hypothetical protein QQ045_006498 [Rhodiola kirilowii]